MAITDWPQDQRPRERLQKEGPDALSDAELLAIFLRVGLAGKSAVDLARDLLHRFDGDLTRLCNARLPELASVSGIGPAKAAQLQAVFTLAKRALNQRMKERDNLNSPQAARDYLRLHLAHLPHEVLHGLFLDSQNRLLDSRTLFRGTLTETAVYPREIAAQALQLNAAALILAHNHPSGATDPSAADITLTRQLQQALALIDVKVLDHFIVAGGANPVSLAERGLI